MFFNQQSELPRAAWQFNYFLLLGNLVTVVVVTKLVSGLDLGVDLAGLIPGVVEAGGLCLCKSCVDRIKESGVALLNENYVVLVKIVNYEVEACPIKRVGVLRDVSLAVTVCNCKSVDLTGLKSLYCKRKIAVKRDLGTCGNKLLVNEELLDAIEALGIKPPFQLSYDGVGQHDFLRGIDGCEERTLNALRLLHERGYNLYGTEGTAKYLNENGVSAERVIWPTEANNPELAGKYKAAMDMLANKELDLVINIPKNFSTGELTNGYHIRRAAIDFNIPLITNARLATAFIRAFCSMSIDDIQIKSWDQY